MSILSFDSYKTNVDDYTPEAAWWCKDDAQEIREQINVLYLEALACCTEITYVNDELMGDPLDVKMF